MNIGPAADTGLQTISREGTVPKTRMENAAQTLEFVQRLERNDNDKRSLKRACVDGLVDGNPPLKPHRLRAAGRADACNVNWGTGRSTLESGVGAFYDLFSEAPGFVSIQTNAKVGSDKDRVQWGQIMSAMADLAFSEDEDWDADIQLSQNEMVLHGNGPLLFEDEMKVFPIAVASGDLKVPERARSKLGRWESAAVFYDYYPPEIYRFIRNPEAAATVGWRTDYTKRVISAAMDWRKTQNWSYNWEDVQNEIKTNSLTYYDDTKICPLAHVFWREFPEADDPNEQGRITHAIIQREDTEIPTEYLFLKVNRYPSFRQCIHPMYYDRGRAGFHHSVTGLGVKMFGAMEYENRLLCNLMDKTFAPKVLFRPTTGEAKERFALATHGDYGLLPAGYDVQQVPIQGFLTDGLAMFKTSNELMRSNLSQYRQQIPPQTSGNPPTKFQKQAELSLMSQLSKTSFSRYYKQLDCLYSEIVRRLCNPNSTDPRAIQYQQRCIDRGVPPECFGRIESVLAVRVVGQGNAVMRKVAVDGIAPLAGALPEEGRQNWLRDKIAVEVGQSNVARYLPQENKKKSADQDDWEVTEGIVMARNGVPPPVTDAQNHVRFATGFLAACVQAVGSVQQGGNLDQVLAFVDILAPGIMLHLQKFANDPLMQPVVQQLTKQLEELSGMVDKLKMIALKMRQARKSQAQKTQSVMTDEQLRNIEVMGEQRRRDAKIKQQLETHQRKSEQSLALADARTASEISRNNLRAFQE